MHCQSANFIAAYEIQSNSSLTGGFTCEPAKPLMHNLKVVEMSKLAAAIKEYAVQSDENYIATRERVMAKAATANNNLEPTVDFYGRLHAPCDGYNWKGEIYRGGAYLPLPPEFYEMLEMMTGRVYTKPTFKGKTTRIKTTASEAEEIKEACGQYAKVSKGKIWDDGVSCYAYIETSRDGLDSLLKAFQEEQAEEVAAAKKAKFEADRLLKGSAPVGRVAVKGVVRTIQEMEGVRYSYYDSGITWKMLVELENKSTVWGSIPSSLDELDIGDSIEFIATFELAEDDETHAFFKHPSKAKIAA